MREDELLQQAMTAVRAGHELTARDIFLEVVEINPRNETAWMRLTGLLDDLDDCIYACERVLQINPNNANVKHYLGQLLEQRKKRQEEQRLRVEDQVRQARELVKTKKQDQALGLIRLLVKTGEVNADVWHLLAKLTPDMDERLFALEELLNLMPENVQSRREFDRLKHFRDNPLELAAMYEEQGNIEKAIEAYGIAALKSKSKNEQNSIY